MRFGIMAAVAAVPFVIGSANAAHAEEWCGYGMHAKSVVECGYTTVAQCEDAVGKGGMCFVDPDVAVLTERRRSAGPEPRQRG
jgi:hypothetical protein